MNETLAVSCNDLDLCLRLARAGYHHLVSPYAELVHHESASRGYVDDPANAQLSAPKRRGSRRCGGRRSPCDPLYNPNLALAGRRLRAARGRREP